MKLISILFLLVFLIPVKGDIMFDKYFEDVTMRIDYFHIGDSKEEVFTIDKIYKYGIWAGSRKNLIDNLNNGRYYFKIYDAASNQLIYSKGFDSYFGEYKTSDWGLAGIKKSFQETAIIPYPKNKIKFAIELRDKQNKLNEIFTTEIDPADFYIIREQIKDENVKVIQSHKGGDPHSKVDVVILGEGYTKRDEAKFKKDLERFTNIMFKLEPYTSHKNDFNIYGVFKPSEESGCDEPEAGIYKNTVLNSTFNSLGSERYLLTEDNKTMRDLASHVPYDAIYIMVNHSRYGGGGIYNLFCTFTADNQWHEYLFLHEFGHSFAGLADEYYTSDIAYNEFYPQGVEPVEPNITALINKDELKWKNSLSAGIEIPTKWEKEYYDSTDLKWQEERRAMNKHTTELKKANASKAEIQKAIDAYDQKDRDHNKVVSDILKNSNYWNKVGVFEGAGYASKGLYRSMLDCIMFSKGTKPFCVACNKGVERVIEHYLD